MFPTVLLIGGLGAPELILILLFALLLFGGRKIPELAKDIGHGIREFRRSMSSPLEDDQQKPTSTAAAPAEERKQIEYQPQAQPAKKTTRKSTRKA